MPDLLKKNFPDPGADTLLSLLSASRDNPLEKAFAIKDGARGTKRSPAVPKNALDEIVAANPSLDHLPGGKSAAPRANRVPGLDERYAHLNAFLFSAPGIDDEAFTSLDRFHSGSGGTVFPGMHAGEAALPPARPHGAVHRVWVTVKGDETPAPPIEPHLLESIRASANIPVTESLSRQPLGLSQGAGTPAMFELRRVPKTPVAAPVSTLSTPEPFFRVDSRPSRQVTAKKNVLGVLTFQRATDPESALRTFAIQESVAATGVRCEVIDYTSYWNGIFRDIGACYRDQFRDAAVPMDGFFDAYERFREHLAFTPRCKSIEDFQERTARYDAVVLTGDRMWDTRLTGGDPTYELSPVPDTALRLAYAAGFGTKKLDNVRRERFRKALRGFDTLSIRGTADRDSLHTLELAVEPETVLDPILLLDAATWTPLLDESQVQEKPYVLICLDKPLKECFRIAQSLRAYFNAKLVLFHSPYLPDKFIRSEAIPETDRLASGGPAEFLGLIRSAEFVLTDAFYATALALVFRRPFITLAQPDTPGTAAEATRELLDSLDLSNRILWLENGRRQEMQVEMSFDAPVERLRERIDGSRSFLTRAIHAKSRE